MHSCLFCYVFVACFLYLFARSIVRLFVPLFVRSLIVRSFVALFVHLFAHSFLRLLLHKTTINHFPLTFCFSAQVVVKMLPGMVEVFVEKKKGKGRYIFLLIFFNAFLM